MPVDPASPGAIDCDANTDSRSARDVANRDAAVLDEERAAGLPRVFAAGEVEAVFLDRDSSARDRLLAHYRDRVRRRGGRWWRAAFSSTRCRRSAQRANEAAAGCPTASVTAFTR